MAGSGKLRRAQTPGKLRRARTPDFQITATINLENSPKHKNSGDYFQVETKQKKPLLGKEGAISVY